MALVKCENLTKAFSTPNGEEIAVDGIDLTIDDNSFATILGPSGCGKTTLLRLIAGLETPTSGEIYYDSVRVTDKRPQDRNISMVFQQVALFPFYTIRENIQYGLKYVSDLSSAEQNEKVEEMAKILDIHELLDKKPGQLSGGQRQRAALGRALVREPDVFLLDEPMSDLDEKLKVAMRSELKKIHQQFPITKGYVTHDQEEALTLSDEIILMNDGKVVQQSSPGEIYQEPNNVFVAQFIGNHEINLIDGTPENGQISTPAFDIDVPEQLAQSIASEATDGVTLGIRPLDVQVVDDPSDALFTVTMQFFEHMGDSLLVHAETPSLSDIVRFTIPEVAEPMDGEQYHLTFELDDVFVFDQQSGEAITHSLAEPPAQEML
ncbi:sugar ABC transporter ATP-binding protein (plasmid) [Salinigranum rubrum]|uniref:ABC-type D-xylose/L-arabinose transporter n=1 Tax=Salinigranum rubrum TaxID=755307 RepID=A0A2I8VTY6_9EURY|nr:ABC transporter ATP-binding protein [Salinigranum rubrum]AUV84649.1 sugar ABC transporter ATP-binding protein [Salinigranum rubrum]